MEPNDDSKTIRIKPSRKLEDAPFIDGSQPQKTHQPTWKENLNYYFSQYCGASSIHGVQYLGERGRYLAEKICWVIIIATVWYFCIMLICKTYNKWITSPVIVSFATTETPISSIPFPAVTICPAVKSDPSLFNFTDILLKKVQRREVTVDENEKFEAFSLVCSDLQDILTKAGYLEEGNLTLNESVIDYLLKDFPSDPNLETQWLGKTSSGNLYRSISSDGICYSFNMLHYSEIFKDPGEYITSQFEGGSKAQNWSFDGGYPNEETMETYPRRTFVSGMNGGFQAIFLTNDSHLDILCGQMLQGFKVTLHHPCEPPNMDQHFLLPLEQGVLVAIKPRMIGISEELKSYKPKDRKCFLTNERSLALFKNYTQNNCLDECLSNYTISKCGCSLFYLPDVGSHLTCGIGMKKCVEESKVNFVANSNCNCLPSCTSLEYDVEISQNNLYWRGLYTALENIAPQDKEMAAYKNIHLSMIAVYYKEMQFLTSERHELYGYVDFFSNTGGLLGLFIGFSVTSAIEILYFLTLRLICNIRRFGKLFWSGAPELINSQEMKFIFVNKIE